jgi:hypothetical protein
VGAAAAAIVKDEQDSVVLNVSITVPRGTDTGSVALSDGNNFTFAGKTFNFAITFESDTYDEVMVKAITGAFAAKEGAVTGTVNTAPAKPEEPPINTPQPATLKIDGAEISIPVPAE